MALKIIPFLIFIFSAAAFHLDARSAIVWCRVSSCGVKAVRTEDILHTCSNGSKRTLAVLQGAVIFVNIVEEEKKMEIYYARGCIISIYLLWRRAQVRTIKNLSATIRWRWVVILVFHFLNLKFVLKILQSFFNVQV